VADKPLVSKGLLHFGATSAAFPNAQETLRGAVMSGIQEKGFNHDEKILLGKVPEDGRAIGNGKLRKILGWDASKYVDVKKSLISNKGVLQPGRGRGGSVSRVSGLQLQSGHSDITCKTKRKEKDVYPLFKQAVEAWAKDQEWTDYFVEHKPDQGKKNTGGMWTRPDLVVVGHKKYEYTPGVVRDIETFEVKLADFSIQAVFETAAHSRCATKSYLAIFRNANEDIDDTLLARTESECQRLQIGLLLFGESADSDAWVSRGAQNRHERGA
jgi:hypothetical protein